MNRYQAVIIYGLLIAINGLILVAMSYSQSSFIQYTIAVGMIVGGVFAILTSRKSKDFQIPFKYHALHGGGMLAYGIAVLLFAIDLELFFNITTFFLLYYGIAEIVFCLQLFILRTHIPLSYNILRMIVGLGIALGAVFILAAAEINWGTALLVAGITFAFSGVIQVVFNRALMRDRALPVA